MAEVQGLTSLVIGASASVWLGQDANSDLQYYHLYDGWAFLAGRFKRELLPAGMQSYFNPLLDAVYAWLALGPLHHLPRVLAGVMGLWFSAVLFLAALLATTLYQGWLQRSIATVLATNGAGLVTQIGTTFNEVQVASFTLGGLLVLLKTAACKSISRTGRQRSRGAVRSGFAVRSRFALVGGLASAEGGKNQGAARANTREHALRRRAARAPAVT